MTEEQRNTLEELKAEMEAAMDRMPQLSQLAMHLQRYEQFVLSFRETLAQVTDLETFHAFRRDWQESAGVVGLPAELASVNNALSRIECYNAAAVPALLSGTAHGYLPELLPEELLDIMRMANVLYEHPVDWSRIRERLIGPKTREAVYVHAVATLEPEDITEMLDEGTIKQRTIESLPYTVDKEAVYGNGENDAALQAAYRNHLAVIYLHLGKYLPDLRYMQESVRGVSFEGRPEKLKYLIRWLKEKHNIRENVLKNFPAGPPDAKENWLNEGVKIELERYTFMRDGVGEPAVRVLASIAGDEQFKALDIGNLPRETAIRLDAEAKNASLSAELTEIGVAAVTGQSGTVSRPYVKLCVTVAGEPYSIGVEQEQNHSKQMDRLFDAEMMKDG